MRKKKIAAILVTLLALLLSMPGFAYAMDTSTYYTEGSNRIPMTRSYNLKMIISNVECVSGQPDTFNNPSDIFINGNDEVFIADTGNNRIVKISPGGVTTAVFTGESTGGFKNPQGVFADKDGNMYIADTDNERIVHLSADGSFIEAFGKPESDLLGEDFTYDPSKICISSTGYIYVVKGQNILTLDANNKFRGYFGQSGIGYSFKDVLLRTFASEEQKKNISKRLASAYQNITLSDDGMIYATTLDKKNGEIKKLNSVGNNIYKKYGFSDGAVNPLLSIINIKLAGSGFTFGENMDDNGKAISPSFVDIAVDKNGIVTVAESQTGKIYQYDGEGNILTVFGGKSDQKGKFDSISSIATDSEGNLYVLDRNINNIQIFAPTRFISEVHKAVGYYSNGNYETAYEIWNSILKTNENYKIARDGLAKSLYKQKNYELSMQEYKIADNTIGYSQAFNDYRHAMFRSQFPWIILAASALMFIIFFLVRVILRLVKKMLNIYLANDSKRASVPNALKFSIATLLKPSETFAYMKSARGLHHPLTGILLLASSVLVRVIYILIVHYPLAEINLRDVNMTLEVVKIILPLLTWVVASFAVTSIMDGESKMIEVFTAGCYCMIPYIIFTIPIALLSQILGRSEIGLFSFLVNGVTVWVLILLFKSLRVLNDYKFGKTILVAFISILIMLLLWAVSILGATLLGQFYQFIAGIILELKML